MNTKINLLYVDGHNYKKGVRVVVHGAITEDHISAMHENMDEGLYIIADQVGLPSPSIELAKSYQFPNGDDHVWTTLEDFLSGKPNPEEMLTEDEPTLDLSIEELASKISQAIWDEELETDRIKNLFNNSSLENKLKLFHFSVGNSSIGPIGMCSAIRANTEKEAVERLHELLPQFIPVANDSIEDGEYINIYLNPEAIQVDHIDDFEEE